MGNVWKLINKPVALSVDQVEPEKDIDVLGIEWIESVKLFCEWVRFQPDLAWNLAMTKMEFGEKP